MGAKYTLVTAVLMTMATVVWIVSALLVPTAEDQLFSRWFIVLGFAVLAAFYWSAYFRRKNAETPDQISGAE